MRNFIIWNNMFVGFLGLNYMLYFLIYSFSSLVGEKHWSHISRLSVSKPSPILFFPLKRLFMLFNIIPFIIFNWWSTYKAILWLRIWKSLWVYIETSHSISLQPPFLYEILKVGCTLKVYLRIVRIYIWM